MNNAISLAACTLGLGLLIVTQGHQQLAVLTPEQAAILSHLSIVDIPDDNGILHQTVRLSGMNLQIASGDGLLNSSMQTGNLIVGYPQFVPSGSHNVLVGDVIGVSDSSGCMLAGPSALVMQSDSSYVFASEATVINAPRSALLGGSSNSVQGGTLGTVVGGSTNCICAGTEDVVVGGIMNCIQSPGRANFCGGGAGNEIGEDPSVCLRNGNSFEACSVIGGESNYILSGEAEVYGATITGGTNRQVTRDFDWRAGDLFQDQ